MTDYIVRHKTVYRYNQAVPESLHLMHLRPRDTGRQRVVEANLAIAPEPSAWIKRRDAFGNETDWVSLDDVHDTLTVSASALVETSSQPLEFGDSDTWESVRARLADPSDWTVREVVPYLYDSPMVWFQSDVASYALQSFTPGRPILDATRDLMIRIQNDFRYDTGVTDVSTPVDKVFAIRAGVCQDLAHVGIAALRSVGLAGRYVSGYLLTQPPPGTEKLLGADASHAWFAVWCPPFGWVDFDPTNAVLPSDQHVTLAFGRDYSDVAPITGIVFGGGDHVIDVGVDVIPVSDAPARDAPLL
jgi:transglutaminase-like putative cysteine protease